jgi:hypothetical protein
MLAPVAAAGKGLVRWSRDGAGKAAQVGEYVAASPWAWAWLASVRAELRAGAHVVDLAVHPAPGEHLGDEWQPVAEHPQRAVWLVRRGRP